jgi:tRNA U34 5-carboxymethylaminomethyl modifying enzyme MnmG/GidA
MRKDQYRADISTLDFDLLRHSVCPEEVDKLRTHRPATIHAASRIPGIRPTTLIYLHQIVRKTSKQYKSVDHDIESGN